LARPTATARLFFALWPDAVARAHLARWASDLHRSCGGRRVPDEDLHITLAFLGGVPLTRLPELSVLAESLPATGFALRFDVPGYWPRRRLAWAAPVALPEGLAALAAGLASGLRTSGFKIDDRPYFAHVTLIRDAACHGMPPLAGFGWDVSEFVLVESTLAPPGSTYRILERWPLPPATRSAGNHPHE
jgi:2'-5' RNA ligase